MFRVWGCQSPTRLLCTLLVAVTGLRGGEELSTGAGVTFPRPARPGPPYCPLPRSPGVQWSLSRRAPSGSLLRAPLCLSTTDELLSSLKTRVRDALFGSLPHPELAPPPRLLRALYTPCRGLELRAAAGLGQKRGGRLTVLRQAGWNRGPAVPQQASGRPQAPASLLIPLASAPDLPALRSVDAPALQQPHQSPRSESHWPGRASPGASEAEWAGRRWWPRGLLPLGEDRSFRVMAQINSFSSLPSSLEPRPSPL